MRKLHINTNILLIILMILGPITIGNIYAQLRPNVETALSRYPANVKSVNIDPSWKISEKFTASIKIYGGANVYGWQTYVVFDPRELVLLKVTAGDFTTEDSIIFNSASGEITGKDPRDVNVGDAWVCYATDIGSGKVLIFGCTWGNVPIWGNVPKSNEDGVVVATITFGVWNNAGGFSIDQENPVLVGKNAETTTDGWLAIEWN